MYVCVNVRTYVRTYVCMYVYLCMYVYVCMYVCMYMCVCVCVCMCMCMCVYVYVSKCGPGSSVGIATELRAGRSGDRIPMGRDFPPVQTGLGAHLASCTMGTGVFPRGKVRPGPAADHSPPSSAAVMEE